MSINGGDAAEQMVRILLDGTERAVRIVGDGAKNLAAFLYAWTRASSPGQESPGSASGKTNLSRLLRSGQELHVFRLRPEEYAAFRPEARTFRLLYAALRNKKDPEGCIDLIVRADAIPRVNHIFERIGYAQLPGQGGAHIAASAARESKKKTPSRSDSAGQRGKSTPSTQGERPSIESRTFQRPSVRETLEQNRRALAHRPSASTRERRHKTR